MSTAFFGLFQNSCSKTHYIYITKFPKYTLLGAVHYGYKTVDFYLPPNIALIQIQKYSLYNVHRSAMF